MAKLIKSLFPSALLLSGVALAQEADQASEEQVFLIGSTDINEITPKSLNIEYQSKLFPNRNIRITDSDNGRMPDLYVNGQKIKLKNKVLSSTQINASEFLLEEYLMHIATSEPLKCHHLSFTISGHEIVKGGSYGKCDDQVWIVKLYGVDDPNKPDNIVYNSDISDELHKDGFWKKGKFDELLN